MFFRHPAQCKRNLLFVGSTKRTFILLVSHGQALLQSSSSTGLVCCRATSACPSNTSQQATSYNQHIIYRLCACFELYTPTHTLSRFFSCGLLLCYGRVCCPLAQILLTDSYGDGWVGGVPGYYNLWTLSQVGYETAVTRGTLADNHDSATVTECLADGDYIFNTTATSAFSADMGWKICNEYGTAGEFLASCGVIGVCLDWRSLLLPEQNRSSSCSSRHGKQTKRTLWYHISQRAVDNIQQYCRVSGGCTVVLL